MGNYLTPGEPNAGALPLSGVRVVELGRFASAPSCATVLADWGANVLKIEPLAGDPAREPGSLPGAKPYAGRLLNPRFDVHNRSRRSIAIDLGKSEGSGAARRIIGTADVFVTNLRLSALNRLDLSPDSVRELLPSLVFAHITGYSAETSLADARSYDHGAFWSYAGVASMFAKSNGEPPQPAGGFGDRAAGSMLAGAVSAALYSRERTGCGAYVTTSLVNTGIWLLASDVSDELTAAGEHRSRERSHAPVPTLNSFRTSDGRWLWLQVMIPEREWPVLLAALEAPWLDDDPRFRGGRSADLAAAREDLLEAFDEIFRRRSLADWGARLTQHGLTWAPVRTLPDVVGDREVRQSSAFVDLVAPDGTVHPSVNSPCTFSGTQPALATTSPSIGEHTELILREAGYSSDDIEGLANAGVVRAVVAAPSA